MGKDKKPWNSAMVFDPLSFLSVIEKLKEDFLRIEPLVFEKDG